MESRHAHSDPETAVPLRAIDSDRVALARTTMPESPDVVDLADVFALLGEPNRVRILISLLGGPMCVRDLAAVIGLSESAVSHALRLLRMHRVVEVVRSGRVAHYTIADSHVRDLLERGLEHIGHTVLVHSAAAVPDPTTRRCAATQLSPQGGSTELKGDTGID